MAAPAAIAAKNEIVRKTAFLISPLNAQTFSGATDPSSIYRALVSGYTNVFPYYREIEEKDSCIASSLEVRKLLVTSREWNVVGADEADGRAQEYKDEAAAFLRAIPNFTFVIEELLDAPAYGYAVAEIMWRNDGGRVDVERIIGRPQEFFRFSANMLDPELGDLRYLEMGVHPGEEVPQEKFLVSSFKPRHGDRRGRPLLRRLFWPSWFQRNALRLDLQFLEKPVGTVAVKYPNSAGPDEKANAYEVANAIVNEVAVAVPESFSIMSETLYSTRTRTGQDFSGLIDYLDAEKTRMILGQTLSTRGSEQGVGTQALGKVHQDLLYEIVSRDAAEVSNVIDEQLLKPWLLWTFGEAALDRAYRPHFAIDMAPEEDVLEQAKILKEARGLVAVTRAEAYRRLQISEPEENEALVNAAFQPIELGGFEQ